LAGDPPPFGLTATQLPSAFRIDAKSVSMGTAAHFQCGFEVALIDAEIVEAFLEVQRKRC